MGSSGQATTGKSRHFPRVAWETASTSLQFAEHNELPLQGGPQSNSYLPKSEARGQRPASETQMGKARRAGLWRRADGRSTGWQVGEGQAASGCLRSCIPSTEPRAIHHNTTPAPLGRDTPGTQTGEARRLQLLRESGLETGLGIVTQKHRLSTEPPSEETRGDLSRRAEHSLERHRRGPREKGELGMAPQAHTSLGALIRLRATEGKG